MQEVSVSLLCLFGLYACLLIAFDIYKMHCPGNFQRPNQEKLKKKEHPKLPIVRNSINFYISRTIQHSYIKYTYTMWNYQQSLIWNSRMFIQILWRKCLQSKILQHLSINNIDNNLEHFNSLVPNAQLRWFFVSYHFTIFHTPSITD